MYNDLVPYSNWPHNVPALAATQSAGPLDAVVIRMSLRLSVENAILVMRSDGIASGQSVGTSRRGLWDGSRPSPRWGVAPLHSYWLPVACSHLGQPYSAEPASVVEPPAPKPGPTLFYFRRLTWTSTGESSFAPSPTPRFVGVDLYMDLACSARQALQGYAWRWSCETVNFYLKIQAGLEDFRVQSYEAVDKYLVVVHLAWAYVEQRFTQERSIQASPCGSARGVRTYGDIIRRHRDEHAIDWLEGAIQMAIETSDAEGGLRRFLRLEA